MSDLMREMPRFRQEHIDAYFGVFADVIRFCGFRGWVILIDEVELIAHLGRVSRLQAYGNLNWLLNFSGELKYPIYAVGVAALSLQNAWSSGNGRRAPDQVGMPELAEERFGLEERRQIEEFFDRSLSDHCPRITMVDRSCLNELLNQVVQLHGASYGWQAPNFGHVEQHLEQLSVDDPVRTYIRATLEVLDNLAMTGETPEIRTEELVEGAVNEDPEYFREVEDQ